MIPQKPIISRSNGLIFTIWGEANIEDWQTPTSFFATAYQSKFKFHNIDDCISSKDDMVKDDKVKTW